jgi:hypothetical protein
MDTRVRGYDRDAVGAQIRWGLRFGGVADSGGRRFGGVADSVGAQMRLGRRFGGAADSVGPQIRLV